MGFLGMFKKKESLDYSSPTPEISKNLQNLPPIEPDVEKGKLPPPFPDEGIPNELSKEENYPSKAKLPEDPHHYDSEETLCLDLRPKKEEDIVEAQATEQSEELSRPNIVVKKPDAESMPNIVVHKEPEIKKEEMSSLPSFTSEEKVSFDDLPSFDEGDLQQESSTKENLSVPETVQEIYVEKHKYTNIITEWKNHVSELHKKVKSEKSFDHYDDKLQSLCTKANTSFARMQKNFVKMEETLSQNQ